MNNSKLTVLEKRILTMLLEAYERKSEGSAKRTIIKADKFEDYDLNQIDRKKNFINTVKNLSDRELIKFEWKRYEKDNLLERIILIEAQLDVIYEMLGRKTKPEKTAALLKELLSYQERVKCQWIQTFLEDERNHILSNSSWTSIWPETETLRSEFVDLLSAVDERQESAMRYLSVRLYSDSKKLEKMYKSKLISVARKYLPLRLDDEEVLAYLGIMLNPTEILVYGAFEYTLHGSRITTASHLYGTSINLQTVKHMTALSMPNTRVLTIENKSTYYEYIKTRPKGVFVIYLGGFFGSAAAEFLLKLHKLEHLYFYHWSDIDLGGFRIYRYLKSLLGESVQPLGMDSLTYMNYLNVYMNTEAISTKQINEMKEMLNDPEMACLKGTIQMVIDKRKRLEQECIEIPDIDKLLAVASSQKR
jgi:hypothetical protein